MQTRSKVGDIIMLGFYEHEARDYARERGWTILRGHFRTPEGHYVVYLLGAHPHEAERFAGLEVAKEGGIIFGPHLPDADVIDLAESRARL